MKKEKKRAKRKHNNRNYRAANETFCLCSFLFLVWISEAFCYKLRRLNSAHGLIHSKNELVTLNLNHRKSNTYATRGIGVSKHTNIRSQHKHMHNKTAQKGREKTQRKRDRTLEHRHSHSHSPSISFNVCAFVWAGRQAGSLWACVGKTERSTNRLHQQQQQQQRNKTKQTIQPICVYSISTTTEIISFLLHVCIYEHSVRVRSHAYTLTHICIMNYRISNGKKLDRQLSGKILSFFPPSPPPPPPLPQPANDRKATKARRFKKQLLIRFSNELFKCK